MSLERLSQATLEGIACALIAARTEDGRVVNLPPSVALSTELLAMYPASFFKFDETAARVFNREFNTNQLGPNQFRRISELLTEFRWLQACFTSFLPQDSKEYKMHKAKAAEIGKLRELCENEAMK